MTSKGTYPEKFGVNFIHADFLWNISSAIGGYKAVRRWEFVPFAGFGAAMAKSTNGRNKKNELAFTAGLINKIRVANALDINIELRGMLVNQRFDGVTGGRKGEGMGSVTAGLTYKFNRRGFDKYHYVAPADYTPYNNRIAALEKDLSGANSKIAQLNKDLTAAKNVKPQAAAEYIFPDMAIFFPIGKATLSKKEQVNVNFIAEAIKKMPAGRTVVLDGNADSVTGTKKGNMTLSEKRIKTVYDALIAAGVRPDQLEFIAHGDTREPFGHDKPALNRVLIIEH
jgi:outer membrane protein OmpA-like peptidoglycan-associated protein